MKSKIIKVIFLLIPISFILNVRGIKDTRPSISVAAVIQEFGTFPNSLESKTQIQNEPAVVKPITLLFTGDINLGRCVAGAAIRASDYTYPFQYVSEKLSSADITIGSLDGTISDQSNPQSCPDSMNLIGPQAMVQGLQAAGFDAITIATNHVKDCGDEGFYCDNRSFFDTLNTLTQAGIQPIGGGQNLSEARKPVIIEKQGVRFAFLGIDQINSKVWATEDTPGVTPLSAETIEQIKADIISARTIADVVIVMPHWGTEYSTKPDDIQLQWAQEFMNAGAALVIGNHPHIIQPMETFSNGTVFYALGNFIFDQGQNSRREGLVIQATFIGTKLESTQMLPVDINYYTYQPHWAENAMTKKILARVTDLSR